MALRAEMCKHVNCQSSPRVGYGSWGLLIALDSLSLLS